LRNIRSTPWLNILYIVTSKIANVPDHAIMQHGSAD
jgi:hypothetical protein